MYDDMHKAADEYAEKNNSYTDNDLQNAIRIAVKKAFVAGVQWGKENAYVMYDKSFKGMFH